MKNPSIDYIVKDTRARNLLKEYGYLTYNDLKELSYKDIRSMKGLGGVCGIRAYEDIQEYKKVLYTELIELTKIAADKYGIEKIVNLIKSLDIY